MRKRIPGEFDYAARGAFLYAWDEIPPPPGSTQRPAPLDRLLNLLPAFSIWATSLKSDDEMFGELALWNSCRIACLDEPYGGLSAVIRPGTKAAASRLRVEVCDWMNRYRFRDPWLGDVALLTLFYHTYHAEFAQARRWFMHVFPDQIQPKITYRQIQFRPDSVEDLDRRKNEAIREIVEQTKEQRKLLEFRLGLRANQESPAKWTAMVFAGFTYRQIADLEKEPTDEGTVRKAVEAFMERSGLNFMARPFTLATSLAAKAKKPSRSRQNAATRR